MDGKEQTKELGKKELSTIEELLNKWKNARAQKQYKIQGEMSKLLIEHFSSSKGLVSVLNSFNESEASEIVEAIEQRKHEFNELEEEEKREIIPKLIPSNETSENSSFLMKFQMTSKEIDKALSDQIESLRSLDDVETEGFETLNNIIPHVKQINKDTIELFVLVGVAIVLMFIFSYLYHYKK